MIPGPGKQGEHWANSDEALEWGPGVGRVEVAQGRNLQSCLKVQAGQLTCWLRSWGVQVPGVALGIHLSPETVAWLLDLTC